MNNPHHHHDRVPPETDRRHAAQRHGLHLRAHCRHTRHAGLAAVLDCAAAGPPAAHQGAGCRAAEVAVPLPEVPAPHLALTPLPCPLRPSFSIPPSPPRSGEFFFRFFGFFPRLLLAFAFALRALQQHACRFGPPPKSMQEGHACLRAAQASGGKCEGKNQKKIQQAHACKRLFHLRRKSRGKEVCKGSG